MPYKNTVVLYLTIDSLTRVGRVTKSLPARRAGEYRWRLIVNLPEAPPVEDITLTVPEDVPVAMGTVEPVVETQND